MRETVLIKSRLNLTPSHYKKAVRLKSAGGTKFIRATKRCSLIPDKNSELKIKEKKEKKRNDQLGIYRRSRTAILILALYIIQLPGIIPRKLGKRDRCRSERGQKELLRLPSTQRVSAFTTLMTSLMRLRFRACVCMCASVSIDVHYDLPGVYVIYFISELSLTRN